MKLGKLFTVSSGVLIVGLLIFAVAYPLVLGGADWVQNSLRGNGEVDFAGQAVGHELIGQQFTAPRFFHSRPSASGYDPRQSASTNLGPNNPRLEKRVRKQLKELAANKTSGNRVPADLITESGSALDPHISPAAARFQVPRVAVATGLNEKDLKKFIQQTTRAPLLGLFGQKRVNVLKLNMKIAEVLSNESTS